jgi:hypothetical protein
MEDTHMPTPLILICDEPNAASGIITELNNTNPTWEEHLRGISDGDELDLLIAKSSTIPGTIRLIIVNAEHYGPCNANAWAACGIRSLFYHASETPPSPALQADLLTSTHMRDFPINLIDRNSLISKAIDVIRQELTPLDETMALGEGVYSLSTLLSQALAAFDQIPQTILLGKCESEAAAAVLLGICRDTGGWVGVSEEVACLGEHTPQHIVLGLQILCQVGLFDSYWNKEGKRVYFPNEAFIATAQAKVAANEYY